MKKIKSVAILAILLILLGCSNKKYTLLKTFKEPDLTGGGYIIDSVKLSALNDSMAYSEGYSRFLIDKSVYNKIKNIKHAISFSVLNSKREDVSLILNKNAIKTIEDIENKNYASLEGSLHPKTVSSIDSNKINNLIKFFNINNDEFDTNKKTWYVPKSAPQYVNRNGIYCYFGSEANTPNNFRLKIQYTSDDWLFIERYQFSIDGKPYDFNPDKVERDNGNGDIWEWCDENTEQNKDLIIALSNAKVAKIKFIGTQYNKVKTISKEQILSIKKTFDLYKAMGGAF